MISFSSKHNMFAMIIVTLIILYFTFVSNKFAIYDSYLGRAFIAMLIILLTYFNTILGVIAVFVMIALFGLTTVEPFVSQEQLFEQQNKLQKNMYYVPKRMSPPVPQNDTEYVPLNPMQSKAGAIQPSQPAPITKQDDSIPKKTGHNYHNLLRIQEMVRPKSSKTMNYQTGLNKDYDPESNWPDGNAFKNPYSAAEN